LETFACGEREIVSWCGNSLLKSRRFVLDADSDGMNIPAA
jgi:hypothetical protein